MKKSSLSTVGGIIAAIVASLCCIGPVLLALVGIGSVGAFAAFEAYRPYLIGVTFLLLGIAFYLVHKKREVACEDGTCKIQDAGKWNKAGVWSATFLAAIAIAFPYLGVAPPSSSVNTGVQGTAIVTLSIEGMDCKACAKGVEGSLASIKGVRRASIDYETGKAVIEYDPAIVPSKAFVDRVDQSGFTAKISDQRKGK
jgi:copper chaperone CopZ